MFAATCFYIYLCLHCANIWSSNINPPVYCILSAMKEHEMIHNKRNKGKEKYWVSVPHLTHFPQGERMNNSIANPKARLMLMMSAKSVHEQMHFFVFFLNSGPYFSTRSSLTRVLQFCIAIDFLGGWMNIRI